MDNRNRRHFGLEFGRASRLRNKITCVNVLDRRPGFPDIASGPHAAHAAIMAATEGPIPTAEEKTRIMTAKKELLQALVKRRALDKQLVR
jgi:hypothetical protein